MLSKYYYILVKYKSIYVIVLYYKIFREKTKENDKLIKKRQFDLPKKCANISFNFKEKKKRTIYLSRFNKIYISSSHLKKKRKSLQSILLEGSRSQQTSVSPYRKSGKENPLITATFPIRSYGKSISPAWHTHTHTHTQPFLACAHCDPPEHF